MSEAGVAPAWVFSVSLSNSEKNVAEAISHEAGHTGLTYAIEASTDQGATDPWTEVTGSTYVNDPTTISFELPAGPLRMFLRLRVVSN